MPLPDFETARRLYEDENKTLADICVMFGLTPASSARLSAMLKKGGVKISRRPNAVKPKFAALFDDAMEEAEEADADTDDADEQNDEAPRRKAGRPAGAKNKPKPTEKATMGVAKKGDNAKVLKHNLVIANWNKPDQNSVREVSARINDYFTLCVKQDMAPTLAGLGLAFKVSRFTIQRWANGLDVPYDVAELFYTAVCTIDADSTQKLVKGMVHPKSGEFVMKNTLGYRDETTVVTEQKERKATVAEIQEKYKKLLGE